jgi:predicted ester cyclase
VTAQANVAAVRDFVERAWNGGDEAVFEEHLAEDFGHRPGGREAFKATILAFRAALPDLHLEVHEMFGVDDRVVTRFTIRGTHEGPFMGVAPTGRRVAVDGIAVDVIRGGKRTEGWAQLDRLGLLQQLGQRGQTP